MTKQLTLVLDTSPLIVLLDELNMYEELQQLAQTITIIIPESVLSEYGKSIQIKNIHIVKAESNNHKLRGLGKGEQAMISAAIEIALNNTNTEVIAVSDDKKARKICKKLGIKCMGTLGIIELMKKKRIMTKEEAINTVRNIEKTSLYVTKCLISNVITKIQNQNKGSINL